MARVRIAVAGAGMIGVRHIEETVASPNCVLASIIDPGPNAAEVARKFNVPLYQSLGECFAKDKPEGVVLATPNAMHVEQGLLCIKAGVPCLVEKPIGHTLEEGRRLVEAAEKANHKLLTGHHRPHSPILHKAVEIVRSGVLGRLVGVIGSAVFYKPAGYYDAPYEWRKQPGGGPDPHQHGPRSRKPARDGRRDRRRAGVRDQRDAQVRSRGHRRDQPQVRERRTWVVPAVGHRRFREELGADVAREQGVSDVRGRGCVRHHRHQRVACRADDAPQALRARRGTLVVEAVQDGDSYRSSAPIRSRARSSTSAT